jgi:hypothetical protein
MSDLFSVQNDLLNEIGGGAEFRVAFRQLIVGAESYCSARLAVAEASNNLAEAKLRVRAIQDTVNMTRRYAEALKTNAALYQQFQQAAFGRLLDAKRAAYLELEKYRRAIRYFTLRDNLPRLPQIAASVDAFIEGAAEISGYQLALEELNPSPQLLSKLEVPLTITDRQRTEDGGIVVQMDTDNPAFKYLARIRIDKIEIALLDAKDQRILVEALRVVTSGTYWDRTVEGGYKKFVGNPWLRLITYDKDGKPELQGGTYARYGQKIFKPTPFTTWTITILPKDRKVAAQIAKVAFVLTGEASVSESNLLQAP